jgi:hypothetical protein
VSKGGGTRCGKAIRAKKAGRAPAPKGDFAKLDFLQYFENVKIYLLLTNRKFRNFKWICRGQHSLRFGL